ncbi:predicted protein [Nematostella vectensis]|uniref:EGF-like domain-containing protein n=1 Tax=Nematostella vectensis TaxID=45351 RepID=A7RRU1_NEMVE|nr:predicted protein [Nematostella vectensis]|eukprot:XP_001637885.1 predicted protein [Nematostella vectensis]
MSRVTCLAVVLALVAIASTQTTRPCVDICPTGPKLTGPRWPEDVEKDEGSRYPNALHYWPFNSTTPSRTLLDVRGNCKTLTYNGVRTTYAEQLGPVLSLDGVDDWILISGLKSKCINDPTLCDDGLTVAFWLKYHAGEFILSGGRYTDLQRGPGFQFLCLDCYKAPQNNKPKNFVLNLTTQTKDWKITLDFLPKAWLHLVITWHVNNGLKLYHNAKLVATEENSTDVKFPPLEPRNEILTVGRPNSLTKLHNYARLDIGHLVIWTRELSHHEVEVAFLTVLAKSTKSLICCHFKKEDPCVSNPCHEGATCRLLDEKYECICPDISVNPCLERIEGNISQVLDSTSALYTTPYFNNDLLTYTPSDTTRGNGIKKLIQNGDLESSDAELSLSIYATSLVFRPGTSLGQRWTPTSNAFLHSIPTLLSLSGALVDKSATRTLTAQPSETSCKTSHTRSFPNVAFSPSTGTLSMSVVPSKIQGQRVPTLPPAEPYACSTGGVKCVCYNCASDTSGLPCCIELLDPRALQEGVALTIDSISIREFLVIEPKMKQVTQKVLADACRTIDCFSRSKLLTKRRRDIDGHTLKPSVPPSSQSSDVGTSTNLTIAVSVVMFHISPDAAGHSRGGLTAAFYATVTSHMGASNHTKVVNGDVLADLMSEKREALNKQLNISIGVISTWNSTRDIRKENIDPESRKKDEVHISHAVVITILVSGISGFLVLTLVVIFVLVRFQRRINGEFVPPNIQITCDEDHGDDRAFPPFVDPSLPCITDVPKKPATTSWQEEENKEREEKRNKESKKEHTEGKNEELKNGKGKKRRSSGVKVTYKPPVWDDD